MSQHNVLDPRLGVSGFSTSAQYGDGGQQHAPPVPTFGGTARSDTLKTDGSMYGAQPSPQPYYHYPSPQTHTPHQSVGQGEGQSNQTSPEGQYELPAQDAGSPDAGDDQNGDDAKRPRACEACRGLKVRCDQDPARPDVPCKRCAKAGRQCIITQPSRKRQKKADSRVAELEKKLDALTAALQTQQQQSTSTGGSHYATPHTDPMRERGSVPNTATPWPAPPNRPSVSSTDPSMSSNKRRRTDDVTETPSYESADAVMPYTVSRLGTAQSSDESGDKLDRRAWSPPSDLKRFLYHQTPEEFVNRINSIITPDLASTVFNRYITDLAPHLPAVVFPPGTTADQVYREKPILYVCILAASSHGKLPIETSTQIAREAVGAIADCVVRNGAKSLELIQAMQVTALWYKPPEKAEQTNFYQIIHMGAVMALDIGLGKRFNPAKARRGFGGPNAHYAPGPHKTLPVDSDTLEARRAWLCSYYLCASASMVLRRPNLVRWTNYMKECIEVLESHPDAFPSDKLFCQHIKIQHICEDIGLQFLMDDNTANISITDPKVTYALNVLENQLKNWKEQIPPEYRNPELQFFEHCTSLYLHEIALHLNHNIEDFRLPFTEESLKSVNNTSETLTQNQMAALEACLKAAHGILDTMMSFDIHVAKTLPMLIYFVRCTYAIVILIKMHVAVCTPNSELGKMMDPEDVNVDQYIDRLIKHFSYVTKVDEFNRPHPKILRILGVLRDWFEKHKANTAAQQRGGSQTKEKEQHNQTPLDLLSQVATGNSQMGQTPASASSTSAHDWTFETPNVYDYRKQNAHASSMAMQPSGGYSAYQMPEVQGMVDPSNPDYGWGSGFEQAMDMALGGMEGLQGGGLDNWFLGDSMAPFGFNGDMPAVGTGVGQW